MDSIVGDKIVVDVEGLQHHLNPGREVQGADENRGRRLDTGYIGKCPIVVFKLREKEG
jgi:hypothetical protein